MRALALVTVGFLCLGQIAEVPKARGQQPVVEQVPVQNNSSGVIQRSYMPATGIVTSGHLTPLAVDSTGETATTVSPWAQALLSNVGNATAYCASGTAATTSDIPIAAGSAQIFQVTAGSTKITCITNGADTTTMNVVQGAGAGAGGGGGGGGGGGSGSNVSIVGPLGHGTADAGGVSVVPTATAIFGTSAASGGFVDGSIATVGTEADAAWNGSAGSATVVAIEKYIASLVAAPLPGRAATTQPTAVADAATVSAMFTTSGAQVTMPYATQPLWVTGGGSKTDTSALTIIAASGSSSYKEYLVSVHCGRSDAGTTAITVAISEGTKTRTLVVPNSGGGGGNNVKFDPPESFAANVAITATSSGSVTTLYCDAQGFYAP